MQPQLPDPWILTKILAAHVTLRNYWIILLCKNCEERRYDGCVGVCWLRLRHFSRKRPCRATPSILGWLIARMVSWPPWREPLDNALLNSTLIQPTLFGCAVGLMKSDGACDEFRKSIKSIICLDPVRGHCVLIYCIIRLYSAAMHSLYLALSSRLIALYPAPALFIVKIQDQPGPVTSHGCPGHGRVVVFFTTISVVSVHHIRTSYLIPVVWFSPLAIRR